ncbi:MAG: hypothetical protein ACR2FG_00015 [Marmoricola sp.]
MTSLPRSVPEPRRSVPETLRSTDYAKRWSHVWCFVTGLGVGLAALEWSPRTVLLGLVLDSTGVALCCILVRTYLAPSRTLRVEQHRRAALMSLLGVAGVVALSAIAVVSPALAPLTAVSAALTSPLVVHHVHI